MTHEHHDHYYGDDYYYQDDDYYYDDGYYDDGRTQRRRRSGGGGTVRTTTVERRSEAKSSTVVADPYVTLGIGAAGLSASALDAETMSGTDFNLGVGTKGTLISGEIGVHGGGYSALNPGRDIALFGLSGDFRLQPRLGVFEPYGLVGLGVHGLSDSQADLNSLGASLRLGVGADVRFDDFGLSARYLYSAYGFDDTGNGRTIDGSYDASSQQLGLNLLVYF